MPAQQSRELSHSRAKIKLYDMVGKSYDDPLWDSLLDQLTVQQMTKLISVGNFRTGSIENIDKPQTTDADGPMGFAIFMGDPSVYGTAYYASECVLGATWNTELSYRMGEMIGNEGLIGNIKGDKRPYSGWYAPAVNIHRSQFGGRNFEYYSEDGLLSGKMAAGVISGAKSKGVYTYLKHFALNDQETNRDTTGLATWANEQAMRELYFVPFEIGVKEGETTAMMSAFNRIGTEWSGGSYRLLTTLLRQEWGFRGMVITDFNLTPYMNLDQMIRAGGDLNLSPGKTLTAMDSATAVTAARKATKNILYTVANSNAMNGMGENVKWGYSLPGWVRMLIGFNVGITLLLAGWGAIVINLSIKSLRQKKN
jgi:beta-glucosidase